MGSFPEPKLIQDSYQFSTFTANGISQPADSWMKMKNTQLESQITQLVLHDAFDWLRPNFIL